MKKTGNIFSACKDLGATRSLHYRFAAYRRTGVPVVVTGRVVIDTVHIDRITTSPSDSILLDPL